MRKPRNSIMEDQEQWDSDSESSIFERDRHLLYLEMMYQLLPAPYQGQEINRLTLAYFVVSGLDILGALDRIDKDAVINWVLSLQAHPNNDRTCENGKASFMDSMVPEAPNINQRIMGYGNFHVIIRLAKLKAAHLNGSHLASTYCALAILKTVGYDLSLIDSELLLKSMRTLQQPNGCFMPIHTGGETDLRFVYCAAAISSMLKNWTGMDCEKAKEFIRSCQSYDGGFGLIPGAESHGGATYCAVASLKLMGLIEENLLSEKASSDIINVPLLLDWSLQKQAVEDGGFRGRANKPTDTCYAFWVGGVLRILQADKFINEEALREFLLTCQSKYGGFSKVPQSLPDIYHSYYGLCAFSMLREPGLNPICVELGMTDFAAFGL